MRKVLLIVIALVVVLAGGGLAYGLTVHVLPDKGLSTYDREFGSWNVTTQADFQAGVLSNVDVNSSPGDVKIATSSDWLDGYSYRKSMSVSAAENTYLNSGGTITTDGDYTVHTFTSGGTFTAGKSGTVEVLVVGGGGGAGRGTTDTRLNAGGGGAGGLIYINAYTVSSSDYTVAVGAGGAGSASTSSAGSDGSDSHFGTLIAEGGGGGGSSGSRDGGGGGSGGGAGVSYFWFWWSYGTGGSSTQPTINDGYPNTGFGNSGGTSDDSSQMGQGGGGAGAAGSGTTGGAGATYWGNTYAKGGDAQSGGSSGAANTGNGGNAAAADSGNDGGSGGSGIVIVRCLTTDFMSDNSQTDYQMQITVSNSSGVSSGSTVYLNGVSLNWPYDIRFTDSSGTDLLDYWIESYNLTTATVWVEFGAIPAYPDEGLFYIYYGDADATDASNGDDTFVFFDDFEDGDISDWTQYSSGTVSLAGESGNGVLLKTGNNDPNGGYSLFNNGSISSFEAIFRTKRINENGGAQNRYGVEDGYFNGYGPRMYDFNTLPSSFAIEQRTGGTSSNLVSKSTSAYQWGTWMTVKFRRYGDNLVFELYDSLETLVESISNTDNSYGSFDRFVVHGGYEFYTDDIIVRKYADPGPSWGAWGEKETLYPVSNWYNASWGYRAPVTITNTGSTLTDYQVRVDVSYDSDMQADFDDIRFTMGDGVSLLPYWIESYTSGSSAVFWVDVSSVPSGGSTIYMYFHNAAANSASDGPSTFIFFDDFSGDLSKWNSHVAYGNAAINSSIGYPAPCLEIGGGTTSGNYGFTAVGTDASYSAFQDGIVEADIYPATDALPEIIFRGINSSNTGYKGRWDCRAGSETPWMILPYSGWSGFGTSVTRFGLAEQWQKAKLVISGTTFSIYSNGVLQSTVTDALYAGPGEIGVANHYGSYALFDNVRVRQYAVTRPTTSVGIKTACIISSVASEVLDTGHANARWDLLGADNSSPAGTNITFEVRASDTSFSKTDSSPVWQPSSLIPAINGTYIQWRATLSTTDGGVTPVLREVRVLYSW